MPESKGCGRGGGEASRCRSGAFDLALIGRTAIVRRMRISGGQARGITLRVPPGDAVRPATDGMRQAVFSSLAPRLPGARFWDLCAGSGAYGLEALSRGAASGWFVEKNAKAAACVRQNLAAVSKSLGREKEILASVWLGDVLQAPFGAQAPADLIFIDPPYERIEELAVPVMSRLATALAGRAEVLVLFEMPGEVELTLPGWECAKRLGRGARQPSVAFFRLAKAGA